MGGRNKVGDVETKTKKKKRKERGKKVVGRRKKLSHEAKNELSAFC